MKRFPDGVDRQVFLRKERAETYADLGENLSRSRARKAAATSITSSATIAPRCFWAANLADIEKHVLLARAPEINQPTSIVFDLDPGEPAGILDCAEIALHLKKIFAALGPGMFRESFRLERVAPERAAER